MKYLKFLALGLVVLTYIGASYIIFSGTEQEIFTNEPATATGISGGGTEQPVGLGDSLTVVITRFVEKATYWCFIKIPVRRGSLNLSAHGFWFFNIIIPILFFVCIIQEIYNWGKIHEVKG